MVDVSPGSNQQPLVLLVEDNPGDARLAREAFSAVDFTGALHTVTGGDEAIEYLYQCREHAATALPDLILLDWHLPDRGGEAVMEEIQGDADLRPIPVIVLTGSTDEKTVSTVYECRANACLSKPSDPDELIDAVRVITEFWLSVVELPTPVEDEGDQMTP